ncbi:hypothetical protein BU23DRAFT_572314 [Bimuria novae-zelandiae CBS 107.79]|uniref:Rhodopsin domain-containing protein n=1 Tax=Bimuria novae-zelandiae CBS 107.79 TaxID=1447943 RepID=A0A6A5UVW8_9PLEO|nr:hypothetical protein BU23DRAFT_572314 [Bimuria novae-zelandiae CBS 107.79]
MLLEKAVQDCVRVSCKPKEVFSTLNAISIRCNEPIRDKSVMHRTVLIVFAVLGISAIIARGITYLTVRGASWLEDVNMALIFTLDIVLFATCTKLSPFIICTLRMDAMGRRAPRSLPQQQQTSLLARRHRDRNGFVTLALPITQIWNLHISPKKKLGVLLMFSVGFFATIVSIIRLRALVYFDKTQSITWDFLETSLWSTSVTLTTCRVQGTEI